MGAPMVRHHGAVTDLLTRVDRLIERVEQQSTEATRIELVTLRTAIKGLLSVTQAKAARRQSL